MAHAFSINNQCRVFLVIPAVKDLYKFNQTRLIREWGPAYKDFLNNDDRLNPIVMNKHSCHSERLHKEGKHFIEKKSPISNRFSPKDCIKKKNVFLKKDKSYIQQEYFSLNFSTLIENRKNLFHISQEISNFKSIVNFTMNILCQCCISKMTICTPIEIWTHSILSPPKFFTIPYEKNVYTVETQLTDALVNNQIG
ncbi:hypothetical protein Avbf_00383 [Armadillidium vulgare]|nr:hypothetical protein Avbf_00383 [Armadillidium vulgare]